LQAPARAAGPKAKATDIGPLAIGGTFVFLLLLALGHICRTYFHRVAASKAEEMNEALESARRRQQQTKKAQATKARAAGAGVAASGGTTTMATVAKAASKAARGGSPPMSASKVGALVTGRVTRSRGLPPAKEDDEEAQQHLLSPCPAPCQGSSRGGQAGKASAKGAGGKPSTGKSAAKINPINPPSVPMHSTPSGRVGAGGASAKPPAKAKAGVMSFGKK